jgi:hypothetical protein
VRREGHADERALGAHKECKERKTESKWRGLVVLTDWRCMHCQYDTDTDTDKDTETETDIDTVLVSMRCCVCEREIGVWYCFGTMGCHGIIARLCDLALADNSAF